MIRGIHHIGLHSKNFDVMRKFYKDAFGFEQIGEERSWTPNRFGDRLMGVENSSGRLITMKGLNCYIELFEFFTPAPRHDTPATPSDYGYTHIGFEMTDIEAEFERLKGLGMTFSLDAPADLGDVKSVYGRDPDGNVIELMQMQPGTLGTFEDLSIIEPARASA